ncbi:MAG TPA: SDR family NAD(P)-dependent oxidoreductase [Gemmatimonadaceae bacterium]|nr:SDR family NAD(P)-dependent oxidoreductase [Gemmatimonadaceae bacterium]
MITQPVVVITGASSGIGAALARRLGHGAFRLVIAARRADALRAVCEESGPRCRPVVADVTRRQEVERVRDEAVAVFVQWTCGSTTSVEG